MQIKSYLTLILIGLFTVSCGIYEPNTIKDTANSGLTYPLYQPFSNWEGEFELVSGQGWCSKEFKYLTIEYTNPQHWASGEVHYLEINAQKKSYDRVGFDLLPRLEVQQHKSWVQSCKKGNCAPVKFEEKMFGLTDADNEIYQWQYDIDKFTNDIIDIKVTRNDIKKAYQLTVTKKSGDNIELAVKDLTKIYQFALVRDVEKNKSPKTLVN